MRGRKIVAATVVPLFAAVGISVLTASAADAATTLSGGQTLRNGQAITASGPADSAVMQDDGNFVVYAPGGIALWSTGTQGHSGTYLAMQGDGNLVVYAAGVALWQSGTSGHAGAKLVMQTDGNLVIYAGSTALWSTRTSVKGYAANELAAYGWSNPTQFSCVDNIFTKESGWNPTASNPSGAYGIPQALPGSKMASEGADWKTNAQTQIRWGYDYMRDRYGSPCSAWSFWQQHQYYNAR